MFTVRAARGFSIAFENGYMVEARFPYIYQTDPLTVLEQVISNSVALVEASVYKKSAFGYEGTNEFITQDTKLSAEQFVELLVAVKGAKSLNR